MATTLAPVLPGDLITADLFNSLIQQIAALQAGQNQIPAGSVLVPSIFGQTLADAAGILTQPALKLVVGTTLDVLGNALDPDLADSKSRIVLSQNPLAGSFALPGTGIDMVLSASSTGGGQTGPKVTISSFIPQKAPIKQPLTIIGEGFDKDRFKNEVTIGGIPTGTPGPQSTTTSLFVTVPDTIPNAPSTPGSELSVKVMVRTPYDQQFADLTILPPLAGNNPAIASVTDTNGTSTDTFMVGDTVVINGTDFGDVTKDSTVLFGSIVAKLVVGATQTTSKVLVTAPQMSGQNPSNPIVGANITVHSMVSGSVRVSNAVPVTLVLP